MSWVAGGQPLANSPFGFKGLIAEGLHDRCLWSGESPQLPVSVRKLLRVVAWGRGRERGNQGSNSQYTFGRIFLKI